MDHGRYAPQHGWENTSAPDGYGVISEPDFRAGVSYNGRRSVDESFPRDSYGRGAFCQDVHDRNMYPPPPSVGNMWSQPRRIHDEEYASARDHRRHDTNYRNDGKHHEFDSYRGVDRLLDNYHASDNYHESGSHRDFGVDRKKRIGSRDRAEFHGEFEDRYHSSHQSREDSCERDHEYGRYSYDSDYERGKRDNSWRRRDSCESERERRGLSRERDGSPYMRHSRSRSRGHDDRSRSRSRSRSPRARSRSRNQRDGFYDDNRFDRRREYDWDERRRGDSVAPSATVVVKGLSLKTNDDDLYQILAQWGPLRSVRVIKERNSGMSRGFAFIDFPTVEAARRMMEGTGENGLEIDGRNVFFEYSKPTGGMSGPSLGQENFTRPTYGHRTVAAPCDWICAICGCMNFARRTSCFQCNEPRTEDALPADATGPTPLFGRRGSELGPTHVLVVRGLDENADEEMLRYEFAKHAPIKDIRLVRDKFTHVSRGFAFVHFHSVEDATKALEATNGITLEKNGQVLRIAYAKSTHVPVSGASQSNSLAVAAIEAASFAQQYDAIGWAPKEYNADDKLNSDSESQKEGSAAQSGFVWDEKSGYYYDSASGFYYDGNTGLYYDSNSGVWYSYDQQTQQYVPCNDQSNTEAAGDVANENTKSSESNSRKKVVISAPAATIKQSEKTSLPEAVQAAANAALAAEKREKEKAKEIKLASKTSLLANKKKMNNVLAMWKQRNQESQAARIVLDDKEPSNSDDQSNNTHSGTGFSLKSKPKSDFGNAKDMNSAASYNSLGQGTATTQMLDSDVKPRPVSNSLGTTVMGVIRGSARGVIKSDTAFHALADAGSTNSCTTLSTSISALMTNAETPTASTPFKTDISALVSNTSSGVSGSGKRRFSEAPGQPQYRDRAAERRNLYGSSLGNDSVGLDSTGDYPSQKGSSEIGSMPFPPGVGERSSGEIGNSENYEVITADRAIDESNVGNRILRNMGWQEGLGLGKDGSGIKEPVQAKSVDVRAGLGSQQRKPDPSLEAQAGDSYKTIIQKKAIARFREMS
ncbi:SUPPRESSOR OF ABI3-5-like isoform X2 [Phragmites australis]|uniref:SUPPRESSOR OF ABI3-5-like isoform X2 n=1 Tax=Phragmites australis TaxID=29695 RepID=UPI002D78308D|nr:SUPPRESSOR OF ABI3-5-like isoform X2 [Phragmites australis]